MKKYRIICPECSTGFLVDAPEALVWDRCPVCKVHVWDMYDALMADRMPENAAHSSGAQAADN